ncbi:MAG: N-methyl-L-tryptophan oxidase [Capsulimonadaceae bacterium]
MKAAVIGLGGSGSAALRFLAHAGHEAVGFEQFALGHDRSSSFGESRLVRDMYPDPFYTAMMDRATPMWRQLEDLAQTELIVRTGGITLGSAASSRLAEFQKSFESQGISTELLDSDATMDRFPDFQLRPDEVSLYQDDCGFLRSSACVAANLSLAAQAGATMRAWTTICSVEPHKGAVLVRSNHGEELFDRVVLAAGAWVGHLVKEPLPLRVTRQYFVYLGSTAFPAHSSSSCAFPTWVDIDSPENFFGFPPDGQVPGIKIAAHQFGPEVDPDELPDAVPSAELKRLREYVGFRFPDIDHAITSMKTCLFTVTPDEAFIIDEVGPGIWMVSGCSGHGFKFTVLLGQIAAGLATGQPVPLDMSRLSLSRFAA